jgi:hypothetical protein
VFTWSTETVSLIPAIVTVVATSARRLCFFGVEFVNRQHKPFRPPTMASSTHLVVLASGTFSISVLPSLPCQYLTEPTTPWLSSCGFYGFNKDRFTRAQTINLARMDAIQSKITFDDMGKRFLLCISTADLAATERKRIGDFLAIELPIWWVSNRFMSSNNQPGENGHHSTKNNIWCCGRAFPSRY